MDAMMTLDADRAVAAFDEDGASLASLFEAHVARRPDRLAVIDGESRWTYGELNRAANRIARDLLARLASDERTVALLFRPGAPIVAAILGALKAGKIYVALDPSYPEARATYVLEDCQARVLLTDTRHVSVAARLARDGQQVLNTDEIDEDAAAENPGCPVDGRTGALLLYTSGSTGHPKGVLHDHRNVLVEIRNYTSDAHIHPGDRLAVLHSFSFANSVRNLFGGLTNGAAVFPYDLPGQGLMPLADWIRTNRITTIHTLATTFRAFVDTLPDDATFPDVRVLRLGGEAIAGSDVARFKRHFRPPCVLMHVIGPTETFSIRRCFIDHDWHGAEGTVPVGYPVADKDVILLDESGRPVGPDEPGEIVVRSRYLALEYWRQPRLTEAAFAPDPDGGDARLYFTGDLGVMRADGCLLHLGRRDFQVKIRGQRIETGEIEAALVEVDSVAAAVVHGQSDDDGGKRLVAYVVSASGKTATVSELRQALARTLPDVMMPASFVFLEAFPLLANGKVDRRALPVPSVEQLAQPAPYVEPRHPLEWQIALIWRELLRVPRVGVFDDFFELGGHSLLAAQLMQRVEADLGCRLPLSVLFSEPTVGGLAAAVQREEPVGRDLVVPLRTSGAEPPFFFFHGDYAGGGFYSRALARCFAPDQPFYAVHPHPLTDLPVPDTMTAMVTQLVAAIRAARPHGPYRLGGHCNGGLCAYEVARRLVTEGDEVEALVIIDASARNVLFRPARRLIRVLARLGRLDRHAEADLFLSLRDGSTKLAQRLVDWSRRFGRGHAASPGGGAEDPDPDPAATTWPYRERVNAFRRFTRSHVPGRYSGSIALLVSDQWSGSSPRSDLWWSLVADRVEVHRIPGAHLTSITEHGVQLAEQVQAYLAGRPRTAPVA